MMQVPPLPLRDVHSGVPPAWWPPAPGWWLLAALGGLLVLYGVWRWRNGRRRARWAQYFDAALAQAVTPAEQLATISALLRRAARRIDPQADRRQGDDWLRLLDAGLPAPLFAQGPGWWLTEGLYRPQVDPQALETLRPLARQRFVQWMLERT